MGPGGRSPTVPVAALGGCRYSRWNAVSPTLAVIVLSTVICLRVPAQLSLQSARRLLVIDTYAIVVMCGLKIMLFAVLHSTCTIDLFITLKNH